MGKGIHLSTFGYIIMALIVLILALPLMIRTSGAVWDMILKGLGIVRPLTPLEQAIRCVYLRCTAGCLDSRLEEITWEEDGKIVNCMIDFCGAEIVHICGEDSIENPVKIKISSPQEISHDNLNIVDCITDNGEGIRIEQRFKILSFSIKDVVSAERDGQCGSLLARRNKYKTVKLKADEYFIIFPQNSVLTAGPLSMDRKHIRIASASTYLSEGITSNEICESNGLKWCPMCNHQEYINKFGRDICVPPDEDCGYTDEGNCLCHTTETCGNDVECVLYRLEGASICLQRFQPPPFVAPPILLP